jgi:putative transposase
MALRVIIAVDWYMLNPLTTKTNRPAVCDEWRDGMLAFYDFQAEHWKHLRTTNVIESSFATVRHCTVRFKGCLDLSRLT